MIYLIALGLYNYFICQVQVPGQEKLLEYGVLGVMCFILIGLLIYLLYDNKKERKELRKEHQEEREAWRKQSEKQFDALLNEQRETRDVLSRINTLLGSIERRI